MKNIVLLTLIFCLPTLVGAQTVWDLKKDEDGIKVYSGSVPNSNVKAIKVTCTVNATLSQLAALLLDAKAHEQWVYNTKISYLVKQFSPNHLVYYSEVSVPWPMTNRDIVVDINITQRPETKITTVVTNAVAQYVPVNNNKVRVTISKATWTITPISSKELSVEYIGQADPGGSIPAWIANTFSTKGPFETFKKLKALVASPAYQHAQYNFAQQ